MGAEHPYSRDELAQHLFKTEAPCGRVATIFVKKKFVEKYFIEKYFVEKYFVEKYFVDYIFVEKYFVEKMLNYVIRSVVSST